MHENPPKNKWRWDEKKERRQERERWDGTWRAYRCVNTSLWSLILWNKHRLFFSPKAESVPNSSWKKRKTYDEFALSLFDGEGDETITQCQSWGESLLTGEERRVLTNWRTKTEVPIVVRLTRMCSNYWPQPKIFIWPCLIPLEESEWHKSRNNEKIMLASDQLFASSWIPILWLVLKLKHRIKRQNMLLVIFLKIMAFAIFCQKWLFCQKITSGKKITETVILGRCRYLTSFSWKTFAKGAFCEKLYKKIDTSISTRFSFLNVSVCTTNFKLKLG